MNDVNTAVNGKALFGKSISMTKIQKREREVNLFDIE